MKLNILVFVVFALLSLTRVVSKNATLVVTCLLGGGLHLVKSLVPSAFGEEGEPEVNSLSPLAVVTLYSVAIAALLYRILRILPDKAGGCSYAPEDWHSWKDRVSRNIRDGVSAVSTLPERMAPLMSSLPTVDRVSSRAPERLFISTGSGFKQVGEING